MKTKIIREKWPSKPSLFLIRVLSWRARDSLQKRLVYSLLDSLPLLLLPKWSFSTGQKNVPVEMSANDLDGTSIPLTLHPSCRLLLFNTSSLSQKGLSKKNNWARDGGVTKQKSLRHFRMTSAPLYSKSSFQSVFIPSFSCHQSSRPVLFPLFDSR